MMSKVRLSVLTLLLMSLVYGLTLGLSGVNGPAVALEEDGDTDEQTGNPISPFPVGQGETSTPSFFDIQGNPQLAEQEAEQEVEPSGDVYQPVIINNWGDYAAQAVDPNLYGNTGSQPYMEQGLDQSQNYDQTYSPDFSE